MVVDDDETRLDWALEAHKGIEFCSVCGDDVNVFGSVADMALLVVSAMGVGGKVRRRG